jgi:predicted Rossmann fold nucleotide-binding protein DprA/Smf involved in DNA uptake
MMARPLRDLGEVLRDGMALEPRVLDALKDGPKTIPEIAEALHCPPREVTLWVMAARRYGRISELPKGISDDYYRYQLKEGGR